MTHFTKSMTRWSLAVPAMVLTLTLAGCASHELQTPVESGDSTLFTSDVGPIDHETIDDGVGVQSATTQAPSATSNANAAKRTHSSIKTPPGAEYGAPTGTVSGSGANP